MLINATLRVEPGHPTLLGSAVALALWLPLSLLRCRAPALALAACVLTDSAWIVWAPPAVGTGNAPLGAVQPAPLATAAAALTLAARAPLSIGGPAGGAAGLVLLAVCALARPWTELPAGLISLSGVVLLSMAGVSVASLRGAREERRSRRAQEVLDAVHGERLRIARDLHDSLAHRLTLVNAQAGVAAYLLATDPGRAAEALNGIEDQSRAAIDELRSTLAVLREEDEDADAAVTPGREPAPDLANLGALLDEHRRTGGEVRLETLGSPLVVSGAVGQSAYRIVQEALTNAARHAPGAVVAVTLDWGRSSLRLRVADGGAGLGPGASRGRRGSVSGTGHGIVGMRERAEAVGGSLTAGPLPGGGWAVVAELPLDGRSLAAAGQTDTADDDAGPRGVRRGDAGRSGEKRSGAERSEEER